MHRYFVTVGFKGSYGIDSSDMLISATSREHMEQQVAEQYGERVWILSAVNLDA